MKFLNVLFYAIPESEYEFIRYRNELEYTAFSVLSEKGIKFKFLKLIEKGYTPQNTNSDEFFFKGKNKFFHLPLVLCRFIKREHPNVIFVHGFNFPVQLLTLRMFISSSTKIIVQHHAETALTHPIKHWLQKLAYSRADAFLFGSPDLASSFLDRGIITTKEKVFEIMEGSSLFKTMDQQEARNKLSLSEEIIFLWVGRLNENKDPFTVLNAFKKYRSSKNNFKLYMIYGTAEMEVKLKKFVADNDMDSSVVFIGSVPHHDLELWYNASDYFISASHYESSGVALGEAMACGCIPIVTKIPTFISMTDQGRCGYLFEKSDWEELYEILVNLKLENKHIFRERAIAKFHKDLSFHAIGRKIYDIAQKLTSV